jgi:hypothetical protein
LTVNGFTDYSWSVFLNSKIQSMSKKLAILTHLKIAVMDVNFIQVDDSGEDK